MGIKRTVRKTQADILELVDVQTNAKTYTGSRLYIPANAIPFEVSN